MKELIKENKLIAAILIAAILIGGALVFAAIKLGGGSTSSKSFAKQFEQYQADLEQSAKDDEIAQMQEVAGKVPETTKNDHVKGDLDALVTIYEYSDFECPFCKRFYQTPEQLVKNNDGLVNTVYRHFPLPFHDPLATTEALASECAADQGKFWEYHDEVFKRTESNNGLEVSELSVIARDLGLDAGQFKSCLDSEKHLGKVEIDIAGGQLAGVTGTPGSIIKNNKTGEVRFIAGAYPIEALQEAIDELTGK